MINKCDLLDLKNEIANKYLFPVVIPYETNNEVYVITNHAMSASIVLKVKIGIFDSSYLIRGMGLVGGFTVNDYIALVNELRKVIGNETEQIYYGDQGLISTAFVGDICYSEYPEEKNLWHMPYNFCLWYYDRMSERPGYEPKIVHFAGAAFKPWECNYPIELAIIPLSNKNHSLRNLKIGQVEYYYIWHEYALMVERILNS